MLFRPEALTAAVVLHETDPGGFDGLNARLRRAGVSVAGATLYCKFLPCYTCAKTIINAGIKEVVYETEYSFSRQTKALLVKADVRCRRLRMKGNR